MGGNKHDEDIPSVPETPVVPEAPVADTPQSAVQNETPVAFEAPVSIARSIFTAVKDGLVNANKTVRDIIVSKYVQDETEKRVKATTTVLEKLEANELEQKKIRPTFAGYDLDGKPQGTPVYQKDQVEAMKKLREKNVKLTRALELALNSNDFSKVFEQANQKD